MVEESHSLARRRIITLVCLETVSAVKSSCHAVKASLEFKEGAFPLLLDFRVSEASLSTQLFRNCFLLAGYSTIELLFLGSGTLDTATLR